MSSRRRAVRAKVYGTGLGRRDRCIAVDRGQVPKLNSRLSRVPGAAAVRSGRRPGWERYGPARKAASTGGSGPGSA